MKNPYLRALVPAAKAFFKDSSDQPKSKISDQPQSESPEISQESQKSKKKGGFLRELFGNVAIAVIAVILVSLFVTPMLMSGGAKETKQAKSEMNEIAKAVALFRSEYGKFPEGSSLEIGKILKNDPKILLKHKRTDERGQLLDPWQHPYQFFIENHGFLIRSAGSDGKFDSGDAAVKNDFYHVGG